MADIKKTIQADKDYLFHHLTQHKPYLDGEPPIFVKGKGCTITNIHGKEFLDATSGGVWCVNVGYGRDSIADAVHKQLKEMPYYALSAGNLPAIELAEKLVEVMPGMKRKVYFSNSGSEANEKAYKMARLYNHKKYGAEKNKILYRQRDYHGTTLAALSSTGQEERRMGFGPFAPGFVEVSSCKCRRSHKDVASSMCTKDCADALEETILREGANTIAAYIVEPITAGGGILLPSDDYFPRVQEICKKYNILLIMDEVVCGWGRTGTWFGYQHYNVQPDIVTMAKGMASAYQALSATVVSEEIYDAFLGDPSDKFNYFRDISTYGGCTGSMAAALENMRIIKEEKLLDRVKEMGDYLVTRLKELDSHKNVLETRGKGLFAGIELVTDKESKKPVDEATLMKVVGYAAQNGVLVGRINRSFPDQNNVINLAPAYVVTKEEIDRIVDTLKAGLETL